jgi:hypothetical protein
MVGLLVAAWSAHAAAQCPPAPADFRPVVNLRELQPQIVYHHDVDIFNMSPFKNHMEKAPTGYLLGLTRNPTFARLDGGRMLQQPLGDGRVCVRVAEVDAVIGDEQMDVYIAANYPEGSCEYDVVRRHENTHVSINLEGLRVWLPTLRATLNEAAARDFPIVSTPERAGEDAGRVLWNALVPVFKLMQNDLERRNGYIDTPEKYRQTALLCKNWFPPGTKLPQRR